MPLKISTLPLEEIRAVAHSVAALCLAAFAVAVILVAICNIKAEELSEKNWYIAVASIATMCIIAGMITLIAALQLNSEANRVNTVYQEISEISRSQVPLSSTEDVSESIYTVTTKSGEQYVITGDNAEIIENESNISAIEFVTYAHSNKNGESVVKEINIYLPKSTK